MKSNETPNKIEWVNHHVEWPEEYAERVDAALVPLFALANTLTNRGGVTDTIEKCDVRVILDALTERAQVMLSQT